MLGHNHQATKIGRQLRRESSTRSLVRRTELTPRWVQRRWCKHKTALREGRVLTKGAIEGAAEASARGSLSQRACNVILIEECANLQPGGEASCFGTDRDNGATGARAGDS